MNDAPLALPDPTQTAALPSSVRLLLDGYEQFDRAVAALPTPGRGGAIGRLNAGSWIVAHVALQQDEYWNVGRGGRAPDAWLAAADVGHGAGPSNPPWDEAVAAWRRTAAPAAATLATLRAADLDPAPGDGAADLSARIARATAHVFVHAAELATIGSLVGAPDLRLPGALRFSSTG